MSWWRRFRRAVRLRRAVRRSRLRAEVPLPTAPRELPEDPMWADKARLADDYPDWLILARPGYGWWATPREPVVPPGWKTYLADDTADGLEAQLRKQERLRGREVPR